MTIAIISNYTLPNGVTAGYHVLRRVEVGVTATAIVDSYSSHLADMITWQDAYEVPFVALSSNPLLSVAEYLISPAGPFEGGTIIESVEEDLEIAKQLKWAEIKTLRDMEEWGGFETPYGRFDSNPTSLIKIAGAVQAYQTLQDPNWEKRFTLADNTSILLTGPQMVEVGLLAVAHVDAVHQKGRALREAIEAATTVEEVQAIRWEDEPESEPEPEEDPEP